MESKNVVFVCILMIVGFARGDVAKDREKCENELIGLATCLPYVTGEARAPPGDCCTGFKQVLRDSRECICILIKDRDDPSLGFKINATRALSLPANCNAPGNNSITDCPTILHLPPNSPDAKLFQDLANKTNTAAAGLGSSSSSRTTSSASAAAPTSDGGKRKKKKKIWFEAQMVAGILLITMPQLHIIFTNI